MTSRLISFLGLGPKDSDPPHYNPCSYEWNGRRSTETPLVERAIVELLGPFDDIVVLGTSAVRTRWIDSGLLERYLGLPSTFVEVGDGKHQGDLRHMFERVLAAFGVPVGLDDVRPPATRIVLDITHGFRIQPVLATSALTFALSEWERQGCPVPEVQVVYGAFEAGKGSDPRPLWDVTEIVTVARWNAALDALIRYGRADTLEALGRATADAALQVAKAHGKQGGELRVESHLGHLAKFARYFADDLALARTRDLFTKSAPKLREYLSRPETEAWLARMPVLRGAVDALRKTVEPLVAPNVVGREGLRSMVAAAEQYARTQRFAELAATLREAIITLHALAQGHPPDPDPGPDWKKETRKAREDELGRLTAKRQTADGRAELEALHDLERAIVELAEDVQHVRNDVEHLGFNAGPRGRDDLRAELEEQRRKLEELVRRLDERDS